ncbi:MAG: aminoacetone oxidase family FAD-binding enzyme [Phycisphaerales bacterium]|jgi:predicted Rossmann fold flavoprotein|nr:aminoacetone oxidase family FAD-binding enzyme [Phycisphaerales bacterium]
MASRERVSVAIVGAGAAGLMAAIHAGRISEEGTGPIVAFDSAVKIGAKILVAGGGRCNVTHHEVLPEDYAGSSRNAIRKVLRAYPVDAVVDFFAAEGVQLKREETGKLFPVTDKARTVLDALLQSVESEGVELRHPVRVESIERTPEGFDIEGAGVAVLADRVILCTGGKALPKTGSDGFGLELVQRLGHSVTPAIHPALVPLLLPDGDPICDLSGIATPVTLSVRSGTGRSIAAYSAPLLCTHFGVSGPVVLDASRHLLAARAAGDSAEAFVDWLPEEDRDAFERSMLAASGQATCQGMLRGRFPERLLRMLLLAGGVEATDRVRTLTRVRRLEFLEVLFNHRIEVVGDRGYTFAEATAGGVPLSEVRLDSMESRIVPGLHLAGEICDVDGRVGGFNFQWAWASGFLAGRAAGRGE